MLEQGKISGFQAILLLINLVSATAVMFVPGIATSIAGRDAWIIPILALIPTIYQAYLTGNLGKIFPKMTLIQYLEVILGTWIGKIMGILYIFFFLHTNSLVIREFIELLAATIYPLTPYYIFTFGILALCAYVIRSGLEVLSRVNEITIPFIIVVVILLVGISTLLDPGVNILNLFPVLENGFIPVVKGSITTFAFRGELILIAMIIPFLAKPQKGMHYSIIVQIVLTILVSVDIAAMIVVFGPNLVARMEFSTFNLIRQIGRLDAFIILIWIASLFGKIALFYYVTVLGTAQILNLKNYQCLVLPIGVLLGAFSIYSVGNITDLVEHLSKTWPYFAFIFEYIIPTMLLVIAIIRGLNNSCLPKSRKT